jgi:hypothetical protein
MAKLDSDQHIEDVLLFYKGEPMKRKTCSFYIRYADGSFDWTPWSAGLSATQLFEDFCRRTPALFPLIFSLTTANELIRGINQRPIDKVAPRDQVFVDARWLFLTSYAALALPNAHEHTYVFPMHYQDWHLGVPQYRLTIYNELTQERHQVNTYFVRTYSSYKTLADVPGTAVLITRRLALEFPQFLPDDTRAGLIQHFAAHPGHLTH